jgi:hypothetical protein
VGSGPKKLETRAELSVDQPAAFWARMNYVTRYATPAP